MYIALDIETTGFDPNTDQIIEIAAIKFEGEQIIEQFTTLINPEIKIPPIISHITGIKSEDVEHAPKLHEIKKELFVFLEGCKVIGHNIDFDINFLNAKGLNLTNQLYDTLQLAGILMPGLSSYSLDTLSRLLKIKHEQKHRALSDTIAVWKLFLILEKKISEIDHKMYQKILEIIKKGDWPLSRLFIDTYDIQTRNRA